MAEKIEEDIIKFLGSFVSRSVPYDQFNGMFLQKFPGCTAEDVVAGLQNLLKEGLIDVKEDPHIHTPVYFLTAKVLQEFPQLIKPDVEGNLQPMLDGIPIKRIHPILDFSGETSYVGVFIPCLDKEKLEYVESLCMITDRKEVIPVSEVTLKQRNLAVDRMETRMEPRWSLASIKAFVSGDAEVDALGVFGRIKSQYSSYIEFPSEEINDLFALWIIGTYLHPLFRTYPYIYIGGIKETGKTKALQVTACLAFNSIFSGNMSASALFRLIQSGRCTLLIDETEYLHDPERKADFRNILLNGYKAGMKVYRTERASGDRFEVRQFEPYSPKMLANITGVEDVLESRCITVIMQRTLNKEIGDRGINPENAVWQETRDGLYVFALAKWREIKKLYTEMENETRLSSREWELWHPILALAKFFGDGLYEKMVGLAERKADEKKIENMTEAGENILVETLLQMVRSSGYYKVKDITDNMRSKFDEEQKWLGTKWVGRALKRLGFTNKRRMGAGVEYFLTAPKVTNLASRLGVGAVSEVNAQFSAGGYISRISPQEEKTTETAPTTQNFAPIERPQLGICSYCGRVRDLPWKDQDGNWLCEECKIDEELRNV